MTYKKPELVAESTSKQEFAADRCNDYSNNININPVTCRK